MWFVVFGKNARVYYHCLLFIIFFSAIADNTQFWKQLLFKVNNEAMSLKLIRCFHNYWMQKKTPFFYCYRFSPLVNFLTRWKYFQRDFLFLIYYSCKFCTTKRKLTLRLYLLLFLCSRMFFCLYFFFSFSFSFFFSFLL